jgi:hypothetical protein
MWCGSQVVIVQKFPVKIHLSESGNRLDFERFRLLQFWVKLYVAFANSYRSITFNHSS